MIDMSHPILLGAWITGLTILGIGIIFLIIGLIREER